MSFLKNLFAGSSPLRGYSNVPIEFPWPRFDRYGDTRVSYGDGPFPSPSIVLSRADVIEDYATTYLVPRAKRFDELVARNLLITTIAKNTTHPISILARNHANYFIDNFLKKDPKNYSGCSIDEEARAFASCCLLIFDGFTVSLVEKELSGFFLKSNAIFIKQASRDFLVSITVRNWIGDIGIDISRVMNRQLESLNDSAPPPFSQSPFDPVWAYFRYLIDFGFYLGIDFFEKGRKKFEKSWATGLTPRESSRPVSDEE